MQTVGVLGLVVIVLAVAALILTPMIQDHQMRVERERTARERLRAQQASYRVQGFMAFLWTCVLIGVPAVIVIGLAHFARMSYEHREHMARLMPPPTQPALPPPQVNIMIVAPEDVTNRGKTMALVAEAGQEPEGVTFVGPGYGI